MNDYLRLDDDDSELYLRLLQRNEVKPEDAERLEHLRRLHLVDIDPHVPDKPVALDPRDAVKHLAFEAYTEIKEKLTAMEERGRGFHKLATSYSRLKEGGENGVRVVDSPDLINESITKAISRGAADVYTAQPTPRREAILKGAYNRDVGLIERGVRFHTVYPDSARAREPETRWVETVAPLGAQVRTCPVPFSRIIYIGGIAAYLPDERSVPDDGASLPGAIEVTHPALLAYVHAQFMRLWDLSRPWLPGRSRTSTRTLTTPRQRTLLRFLENGVTRSRIMKELDLSDRAIRTEISRLRAMFNADTDFQLACRWRESGEYDLPA